MGTGRGHLRIIGGDRRGLRLHAPPGREIRPTADRVREALFDILGARVVGSAFLDACAGTGAVGLEALSRGAARAAFVEREPRAVALLRRNIERAAAAEAARVYPIDLARAVGAMGSERLVFDLVFVDPPYGGGELDRCLRLVARGGVLAAGAIVIAEHEKVSSLPAAEGLEARRTAIYGRTALTFFHRH